MRSTASGWSKAALLALPVLLLAAVALPVRYTTTLSEPDLVQMMAALVHGQATGLHEAAGNHYGLSFSFAWYQLIYALVPGSWLASADGAARTINAVGVACGLLAALGCGVYLRQLFGASVAAASAALFLLAPAQLPLMFSGHPIVPALAALCFGAWLLNAGTARGGEVGLALSLAAGTVLTLSLCLRAEVVLAFPFVGLALPQGASPVQGSWIRRMAPRGLLLTAAFAAFLALQRSHVQASGGAWSTLMGFLESFASLQRVGRGVGVWVLAIGWASTAVALLICTWRRSRPAWGLTLVLMLPTVAFWLPNPQPARHFLFAVLAVSLFLGRALQRWLGGEWRALLAALLLVACNQVLAEWLRPALVSRYNWSYESPTPRRAAQQVPMGSFWADQRANQAAAEVDRQEARQLTLDLARTRTPRLLVLGDVHDYLLAEVQAASPPSQPSRWTASHWHGLLVNEMTSPGLDLVIVQKNGGWPRDTTAEILQAEAWAGWPVHVQPTTRSRYDLTAVPAERIFRP